MRKNSKIYTIIIIVFYINISILDGDDSTSIEERLCVYINIKI